MELSQARLTVVSWLVTAGVFGAGSGILGAVPAAAEPGGGPGPQNGSSRTNNGFQQAPGGPQAGVDRQARPPRVRSSPPGDTGSDNAAFTTTPPPGNVAAAPQFLLPADRVPPGLAIGASEAGPAPVRTIGPAVAPASAEAAPTLSAARTAGPAGELAPALHRDGPVAATPWTSRVSLPAAVSQATLPLVATPALPGLILLAGLVAVGGFLGYRQARTGFSLGSAGTRFIR